MTKSLSEMSNEELWQLFPIKLEEHRGEWLRWYEEERATLTGLIGSENIKRISHIGSTSVPGLIAKPTIDILLEITPACSTEKLIETLEQSGYIYSSQPVKPPPHMMFMKGYTPEGFAERVFHIHVRYRGDWDELAFCEYLRSHPDAAAQYGELKKQLRHEYEHDRDAYTEAKTEFVSRINKLARKEHSGPTENDACSVGIIGGADGPTAVFVARGRHHRAKEKQVSKLLADCKKAAQASERTKSADELKKHLIDEFGAVEIEPMPYQLQTLKLNALMNHHREALLGPDMPKDNAPKEEWLEWARKTHLSYREAAKRLPDDAFGFRYAFLRLPNNAATATYYRARQKENRRPFFIWLKQRFRKVSDDNEMTMDLELSTGSISMGNGSARLMNELVLWRGIAQRDIDEETPEFVAYAVAMRDTGRLKKHKPL